MSAIDPKRPVAIVGAGIAGLVLALELSRRGFLADLFERAPVLETAGAGIQISANALRILERLGLRPALEEVATVADAVTLRSGRTGRPIAKVPVTASDGTAYMSVHRGDLQRVLATAVERCSTIALNLDHRLSSARRAPAGIAMSFATRNGAVEREAEFVVGADGVHSAVAALLDLPAALSTGVTAWRALIDGGDLAPPPSVEAWLGPRRHAVAYPVEHGQRTNLVLVEGSNSRHGIDSERLSREFHGWDPHLRSMIESATQFDPWPILTTPPARPWRHFGDHALLVGDAAHALMPYAAQGAAMAIEDAALLAAWLDRASTLEHALGRYEAARRPRIEWVRRRIAFHRMIYHLPSPAAALRNMALAARSPSSLRRDLAWLYDWQPPS